MGLSYLDILAQLSPPLFNFGIFVYHREKVAIERSRNAVLDMHQFRMLFCTCKIPGVTRDSLSSYFKTGKQMQFGG